MPDYRKKYICMNERVTATDDYINMIYKILLDKIKPEIILVMS